jgi:hypothetical protein
MTIEHPTWATQHKRPGTELRFIRGRYYLYEVSSKWNPEKKRAQKVTGRIMGSVTEEKGFVPSKHNQQTLSQDCNSLSKNMGLHLS